MHYNYDRQGPNEPAAIPATKQAHALSTLPNSQVFFIGQPVQIAEDCEQYRAEFNEYWIDRVSWRYAKDRIEYGLTNAWPPSDATVGASGLIAANLKPRTVTEGGAS